MISRSPTQLHTMELFTPLAQGARHVESFRARAVNYERGDRFFFGPWRAKWEFLDEPGKALDRDYAWDWALTRLGYHYEERIGRIVPWSGIVQEVDLFLDGDGVRYSIVDLANRIRVVYTDENKVAQVTSWYTDAASIAKYGQRDDEVTLEKDSATAAEAARHAQIKLAQRAWPTVEPLAMDAKTPNSVKITAMGYVASLHWRYLTIASGTYTVTNFLATAIQTDATIAAGSSDRFVSLGRMETNSEITHIGQYGLATIWEGLKGVINLRPDPNGPPFVSRVSGNRRLDYYQVDPEPIYRWKDRSIVQRAGGRGSLNPWLIRPHIIRSERAVRSSSPPDSWLLDGRDRVMAEVTMADGLTQPVITPAGGTEAELRKAYTIRRGQTIRYNKPQYGEDS